MNLSNEILKEVEQFSELFFTPGEIAIIIEVDELAFIKEIQSKEGEIYKAFQKGRLLGEAKTRKSVRELADNGSAPAQQLMQNIKKDSDHRIILEENA